MDIEKLRNFEPLFGAWYIDGKVAQGRSSDVYRVRKTENGNTVYLGLKTIRFPSSEREFNRIMESGKYPSAEEYLNSLESKLRINMEKMMQLRANKNIVRFDNYHIVKEFNSVSVIILMELLTPLGDYLSADKINPDEIARMGIDLCSALEGFRRFGIMHREIKPENIFVDSEGTYKLGDFGISRLGSDEKDDEEISTYLAPEVLSGSGTDYCSDIYSLGIMMYKFTNNNRMPFMPEFPAPISMADRQRAFERRMSGENLIKPANANLALSKIIFKATSFRPEERYASPKQLSDDLHLYLSGGADEEPTQVIAAQKLYKTAGQEDAQFGKIPPVSTVKSDAEKDEFKEAFSDDDDSDEPSNKKIYVLIVLIVIAIAVVAALSFKAFTKDDDETTLSVMAETTTQMQTEAPTTETTAEQTTEETTTTQPPTTTETTTEQTTEETTTTQPPTTTTTQPTTEETTTEAVTTQPETEATTQNTENVILYTPSSHKNGDETSDGKMYVDVEADAIKEVDDGQIVKVIVNLEDMGQFPDKKGNAYICQVMNGSVILKESVDFDCIYDEDDPDSGLSLVAEIDNEIYDEEGTDFYIVFEQGAVETDTSLNLPFQVKL
ncbi:MAG: serine/threonine-protein kinase [Acutalibacteraceae bacterium]